MYKLDDIIKNGELDRLPTIIKDLFQDIKNRYKENSRIISECDLKTLDELHEMELLNYDACKGYKLYKETQQTLIKRRIAKDENILLESLKEYVKTIQNFETKLDKIQSGVFMQSANQKARCYRPRVKTELGVISNHKLHRVG